MGESDLARSITATFEGAVVGSGRVPVPDLVALLDGLQRAVLIVVEDLWGRKHRPGPAPFEIQEQATLQFGDVQAGSFRARLSLEPADAGNHEVMAIQSEAIEKLLTGIAAQLGGKQPDLPVAALKQTESLTARTVRRGIRLILEGGKSRTRVEISESSAVSDSGPGRSPESARVQVAGRLLEIDYRDRTAEVWDALGNVTRIRFREDQCKDVDAARQQHVTVTARIAGPTARSSTLMLEALTRTRMDDAFWSTASLSQLASEQGVRPIEDPGNLVAPFWLDDGDEDFVATLSRWRREQ